MSSLCSVHSAVWYSMLFLLLIGCKRSVHRVRKCPDPAINIWYQDDPKTYSLSHPCIESYIFKTYQPALLNGYLLPEIITDRLDPNIVYNTKPLQDDIAALISCLDSKNDVSQLPFRILKQRDYHQREKHGVLIARHTKLPFVVKIFRETPHSFVHPFNRGIEECAFFIMGGGMNRFLAGFTRIKNRELIAQRLMENSYWCKILDVPRKWYWQPPFARILYLQGHNIPGIDPQEPLLLPDTYVIIADAITPAYTFDIINHEQRHIALAISEFLGLRLDPHINNFVKDQDTDKIMIIDTEHFPSMVGMRDPFYMNDYMGYYYHLTLQFLCRRLFMTKKDRALLRERNRAFNLYDSE